MLSAPIGIPPARREAEQALIAAICLGVCGGGVTRRMDHPVKATGIEGRYCFHQLESGDLTWTATDSSPRAIAEVGCAAAAAQD
jgi:hypothetical protein